eukprot:50532_1
MNHVQTQIVELLNQDVITMKQLREIIKQHRGDIDEFAAIKLSGKGRTKAAIIEDLKRFLKQNPIGNTVNEPDTEFEIDPNGHYSINFLPQYVLKGFVSSEHKIFATKLYQELEQNGDYKDWEDVESRVEGLHRSMFVDGNDCTFNFRPDNRTFRCVQDWCGYTYNLPSFVVDDATEFKDSMCFYRSSVNMLDPNDTSDGDEFEEDCKYDYRCISLKRHSQMMRKDPRTKQRVPPRSGNIIYIAAIDENKVLIGHGTGCLIDESHVLTVAHIFKDCKTDAFRKCYFLIHAYDGTYLGCLQSVTIPTSFTWKKDSFSTKMGNDIAVGKLLKSFISPAKYPVFAVSLKKLQNEYITVDGYPGRVYHKDVNQTPNRSCIQLYGVHGQITKSGIGCKSLRSKVFMSQGNSGGPAFLCDNNGKYNVHQNRSPIIVGIAVNLGGSVTGDNTVCTPMTPWALAFVSNAVGYVVHVVNQWSKNRVMCAMKKIDANIKAKTRKLAPWKAEPKMMM